MYKHVMTSKQANTYLNYTSPRTLLSCVDSLLFEIQI